MEVVKCQDMQKLEFVCTEKLGSSELENKRRRAEERCGELELEIVRKRSEYEALGAKFRALEVEKLAMEEEIKALKRGREEIKEQVNSGESETKKFCEAEKGTEIIVDLNEDNLEEDNVFQLMLENKVLECEKKNAESEVEAWKQKFKELESWVLKLKLTGDSLEASRRTQPNQRNKVEDGLNVGVGMEYLRDKDRVVDLVDVSSKNQSPGKGIFHFPAAGTPPNDREHRSGAKEEKKSDMEYGNVKQVRKQLEFKEDRSPCKKMAPPTPGGGIPFSLSVIDISDSDSDDELTIAESQSLLPTDNQGSRKICISSDSVLGETFGCGKDLATKSFLKQTHTDNNDEEDVDNYNEALLSFSTPKRKRASNVVTSDSESSDDNIPISSVKRRHLEERIQDQVESEPNGGLGTASVIENVSVTSPRRRLVRLRKCGGRGGAQGNSNQTSETKNGQGILSNKDVEDDEPEEVGSESEGESLGGFIVNSSDGSESNDASSESSSVADDDVNFDEILSTLQRNKDQNAKWEFETDMLAAFGKDAELCMKAVCALYRQQTSEEKISKGSLYYNSRGFSKFDAFRGSNLAEFLTGGDPNGDLTVTAEELEKRDPQAIETCRTFASRYSKQLFEIYKNKEDLFFLPP